MGKGAVSMNWFTRTDMDSDRVGVSVFRVMDEGAYFYRACCLEHSQSRVIYYNLILNSFNKKDHLGVY